MGNPQEANATPPSYFTTPVQPTQFNNPQQPQFTAQPILAQNTPGINNAMSNPIPQQAPLNQFTPPLQQAPQPQTFQNNTLTGQAPTAPQPVFQQNTGGGLPQQGFQNQQQFQPQQFNPQQPQGFNPQQPQGFNPQQPQGFNPQQPQYPVAAQQTGQQPVQYVQQNPPPYVGQPILQATSPLQILGPGPGPVDCPSCGQRGITRVEYKTGSTTHLWAFVACAFICMPCIPYLINETKDVTHSCPNCGVLLATYMRSGGTIVHAFGKV